MRRLVTLLLCLLAASGARSGFAAASPNVSAGAHGTVVTGWNLAAHGSQDESAADPSWTLPAPVVVVPATRVFTAHAVRQHGAPLTGLAVPVSEPQTARGQSAASFHARIAPVRRGYRATGPPARPDMSPLTNSLARPA